MELFIDFILDKYDCYWLSTHCKGDKEPLLKYLSEFYSTEIITKFDKFKVTNWSTFKTEAVDFNSDFIWLDDQPLATELKILEEKHVLESLVIVELEREKEIKRIIDILKNI